MPAIAQIPAEVTCVWPARAMLGEGPCFDRRAGRLYWVDIKGRKLHAYRPDEGAQRSFDMPWRLCSLDVPPPGWQPPAELAGEAMLGCGDAGLVWLGIDGEQVHTTAIAHPERHMPENRFNDGKAGPDGRYWAGTMHDAESEATGSLYAFSPGGGVTRLDTGYRVTNGPAFSLDGRTVYHNDSARQTVYSFQLSEDGTLEGKRVLVKFAMAEGYPDGMTTDRDGALYIAMWDGARIEKIAPDGARLGAIAMPIARPTSCVFADTECRTLYATSAAIGLSESDALAGGLFRIAL